MTRERRGRKPLRASRWLFPVALAAAALAPVRGTATTELVVADRHTGLAIGGFDPVAYFTDGKAVLGRGEHEYAFAGVVWRFHNPGNRLAFIADTSTYLPRFGGYDPVGVVRGAGVAGNPLIWLISGERLYLFHTPEARVSFTADPEGSVAAAERAWPAVQRTLSP